MRMTFGNRFGTPFTSRVTGLGAPPSGYFGSTPISDPGRLRDKARQKPRRVGLGGGPSPLQRFQPVSTRLQRPAVSTPLTRSSFVNRNIKGSLQSRGGFVRGY